MNLEHERVAALLQVCLATCDEELTCDEALDLIPSLVEAANGSSAEDTRRAAAEQHLRVCKNCREERDALAASLREDSG